MRTSLNEIKAIEDHLLGHHNIGDTLLFEVRAILDTQLRDKISAQQRAYHTVWQYGRLQLKQEIEAVHQQLLNDARHQGFMQKVVNIFLNR
ncbi:hypothetical protein [Mucilaginibacter paludis]|uniref:Uncharacterized protein n=1 Tax=Mucilaginibacter paludis DSM 18603 TaxID=714943 RepID=H1Y2H6_9SPHI|nr:hypothetical protein [Mucilaginibacter paludis]EHQ28024.1 hypothetical protein Mucpa_3933 [Mucilaginibacter paludis DSM 18603]